MARKVTSGIIGGNSIGTLNAVGSILQSTVENDDIIVLPNGSGIVESQSDIKITTQHNLLFGDSAGTGHVAFQAPSTVTSTYTLTLPPAVASSAGFALISDASGTLSWSPAGSVLTDNNTDASTNYIPFTTQTGANNYLTDTRVAVATRVLSYQPSTGTLGTTAVSCTNVTATGTVEALTITETSSITLKENLNPLENALNKILNLQSYTYDRKDGSRKNEVGLIAEEVYEVIPNVVKINEEGKPESISYARLTAFLIESVKDLQNQIDNLKKAR